MPVRYGLAAKGHCSCGFESVKSKPIVAVIYGTSTAPASVANVRNGWKADFSGEAQTTTHLADETWVRAMRSSARVSPMTDRDRPCPMCTNLLGPLDAKAKDLMSAYRDGGRIGEQSSFRAASMAGGGWSLTTGFWPIDCVESTSWVIVCNRAFSERASA